MGRATAAGEAGQHQAAEESIAGCVASSAKNNSTPVHFILRRPTNPGAILREDVLPALEMTQTELAQRLGVSRLTVSDLLHE